MKTILLINQLVLQANYVALVCFQYKGLTGGESLAVFFNIVILGIVSLIPIILLDSNLPIDRRYSVRFIFSSLPQLPVVFFACGIRVPFGVLITILGIWSTWNVFALYKAMEKCSNKDLKLLTVLEILLKK